jgi:hypothetical protein
MFENSVPSFQSTHNISINKDQLCNVKDANNCSLWQPNETNIPYGQNAQLLKIESGGRYNYHTIF